MSRELLKRTYAIMMLGSWFCEHEDEAIEVMRLLEAELAKPVDCADHEIADVSNVYVESGYYCVKCGNLFKSVEVNIKPEPFAWYLTTESGVSISVDRPTFAAESWKPLYTTQSTQQHQTHSEQS